MATDKVKKSKSVKSTKVTKELPVAEIPTLDAVPPKIASPKVVRPAETSRTSENGVGKAENGAAVQGERLLTGPVLESIRVRAYEIWQSENCPHGKDLEHWDRAKQETLSELRDQD